MLKNILFIPLLLLVCAINGQVNKPVSATGPSSPSAQVLTPSGYSNNIKVSFVRTWEAKGPYQDPEQLVYAGYTHVQQTTDYVDGLGRPLQTVIRQMTPLGKDIVNPVIYDELGREGFKFIPYASQGTDGNFRINPFNEQKSCLSAIYSGEEIFYGQTIFEASPLNRVLQASAPGNSWTGNNKGSLLKYQFNTATEGIRIWRINNNVLTYVNNDVSTNIPVSGSGDIYADNQLSKTIVIDEVGHAVVEYKDKEGRIILKKVQVAENVSNYDGHDNFLCTYYVYDDIGRLRFVIPPKAVEAIKTGWSFSGVGGSDIINELCFRYEYDYRGRMIAKKVPGAGWGYMIYDIRDRLVFTQDANMRQKSSLQWMALLYDMLNRPVLTGIVVLGQAIDPASLQTQVTATTAQFANDQVSYYEGVAVNQTSVPAGASFTALTITYYDNYTWTNKTFNSSYNNLLDAGDNLHSENMPSSYNTLTSGLLTGSKVRVIENPDNLSVGGWLGSVSFYDSKGRVIQVQSDNYKGGTDILTSRYDFTGKVLSSYLTHNNPAAGAVGLVNVLTLFHYDHAGRILDIRKKVNGGKEAFILRNEYDESGQLKTKKLSGTLDVTGHDQNGMPIVSPGQPALEILNYDYNVRGWLKGINKNYASGSGQHKFGMELSYDWGFENNQLNGNIAGIKWRTTGDNEQRAYGFRYDPVNRLLKGDFTQNNSGWNTSAGFNFSMQMGDGITATSAYDENGNIKAMKQWGWKQGNSSIIDDLSYDYFNNSNKLQSVTENATGGGKLGEQPTGLGDFTDKNTTGADYGYDLNGNMISDLNKKIMGSIGIDQTSGGAIRYNHLNLPWQIAVKKDDNSEKGNITYIYDAAGNKLEKRVSENNVVKTTTYISGFVYEDNKLQFLAHEEGRVRYTPAEGSIAARFDYDYFIKDHLGNVRMVLTDEEQVIYYPAATLEGNYSDPNANSMINHEKRFFNIEDNYITVTNNVASWAVNTGYQNNNGNPPVNTNYPSGATPSQTGISERLYKLNATTNKTGLQFVLKVMSGDHVDIFGKSYYHSNQTFNNSNSTILDIGTIMTGILLPPGSVAGGKGITSGDLTSLNSLLLPASFIRGNNGESIQIPKAYINYILLDEQFRYVSGSASRVGNSDDVKSHWQSDPVLRDIEVNKNGYLYVYVSNESNVDVFFDNLQIVHKPGPLLEETHYYPFGLTIAGISSKAAGKIENKYKFNSIEQNADLDLNMYDAFYRNLDPQIGRFWQIDPKIESAGDWTPYVAMLNNPANNIDPLGDTTVTGAGGLSTIKIDETTNKLEFYDAKEYFIKGLSTKVPVKAGQLRSYTNSLGKFSARWSEIADGVAGFEGYLKEDGKNEAQAYEESEFARRLNLLGLAAEHVMGMSEKIEKDPSGAAVEIVNNLMFISLLSAAEPVPVNVSSRGNPTFVTQEAMSGLGTLNFAAKTVTQVESKVFLVTKEGVVLPKGAKIPGEFVENKFRSSDFGEIINGKFQSKVRIDPPTPVNMKGPNVSHFHLNGGKEHIFDISRWPWW